MSVRSGEEIMRGEDRFTSGAYAKRKVALVRGRAEFVYDADGKEYIDCISGHGSSNLGHCHPRVVEAVKMQSGNMLNCPESVYNDRRAELEEKLVSISPRGIGRVFLTNSGTEAVEGAMKLSRSATGKKDFVAMIGAFHGRSMGALSLTWNRKFREPFEPLIPGVKRARYGDAGSMEGAIDGNTAAVFLEPILGETGVRIPPPGYLKEVRELCDRKDALMVLDEIQTGFGRTGLMFECMREGVVPDVMCVAKSIAGGLPMGAVLMREGIAFRPKEHGSTFGGNPLVCAAASAAIDALRDERLVERSASEGEYLLRKLKELEGVGKAREARGRGLMIAVELADAPGRYINDAAERGLLTFPGGETAIRVYPPLVVQRKSCDRIREILGEVLS